MSALSVRRRSLLLAAPHRLRWATEKLPPPRDDEVLVQTTAGAISIGSELPLYRGTARSGAPATYPRMTGYESVGRVVARGAAARPLRVGERVVAPYGHRTHGIVPQEKAIVPTNRSWSAARARSASWRSSCCTPLACAPSM